MDPFIPYRWDFKSARLFWKAGWYYGSRTLQASSRPFDLVLRSLSRHPTSIFVRSSLSETVEVLKELLVTWETLITGVLLVKWNISYNLVSVRHREYIRMLVVLGVWVFVYQPTYSYFYFSCLSLIYI